MNNDIYIRRSSQKKNTLNYYRDNVFDQINIKEAITKNKKITKCNEKDFIYFSSLTSEKTNIPKQIKINYDEFDIELDNGTIKKITDYFKIVNVIGTGSFGTVLAVRDLIRNNELVAVKIIPKYKFRNIAHYITNEVSIQSELNHRNIIKLHYIRENMNFIFLVMELMEGGSLKDLIIERYKHKDYFMKDEECSIIIKNILEGINYLHNRKIIHRDIKPENIMFKRKNDLNSAKIGDFGLSTLSDDSQKEKENCGTLIFMSPEMINSQVNEFVDIWACGFILFILASGGSHPIFKESMDRDNYIDQFKKKGEWNFPEIFPILARNLFMKLCKFEKYKRYEIKSALNHPWITRNSEGKIPVTFAENYQKIELIENFKSMLKSLIFLNHHKTLVKNEELLVLNINTKLINKENIKESVKSQRNLKDLREIKKPEVKIKQRVYSNSPNSNSKNTITTKDKLATQRSKFSKKIEDDLSNSPTKRQVIYKK